MPFAPYRATMKTVQSPLQSGFGVSSTASQVIDGINLTGKVAMVTGGASGIGLETVRALSGAGASVVVPARNLPRARQTLNGLQGVEVELMDLMEPASIATFAAHFEASRRPLHVVVASAGIGGAPLLRDSRGYGPISRRITSVTSTWSPDYVRPSVGLRAHALSSSPHGRTARQT